MRIGPEASLFGSSGSLRFSPFLAKPRLAILGINPRKAGLNQIPIERSYYAGYAAPVGLASNFNFNSFARNFLASEARGYLPKRLPALWAVNTVKADANLLVIVRQNGYSISVSNLNDFAAESMSRRGKDEKE